MEILVLCSREEMGELLDGGMDEFSDQSLEQAIYSRNMT